MRTTIPSAIDRSGSDAQHAAPVFSPSAMRPAPSFSTPESVADRPRHLQGLTSNNARVKQLRSRPAAPGTISEAPRGNSLPLHLQSGIEALSGLAMDDVTVHYNSSQPAQIGALAYAQGRTIHLGPGQEANLPHEAWHVVQQAQGRVSPSRHLPHGAAINDEHALESEADAMGMRAERISLTGISAAPAAPPSLPPARSHYGEVRQLRLPSQENLEELLGDQGPDADPATTEAHRAGLLLLLDRLPKSKDDSPLTTALSKIVMETEQPTSEQLRALVGSLLKDNPSFELKLPTFGDAKKEPKSIEDKNIISGLVATTERIFGEIKSGLWDDDLKNAFPEKPGTVPAVDPGNSYLARAHDNYELARASMEKLHGEECIFVDRSGYLHQIGLGGLTIRQQDPQIERRIVLKGEVIGDHDLACIMLLHESMHAGNFAVDDIAYPEDPDFKTLDTAKKLRNASHYESVPELILDHWHAEKVKGNALPRLVSSSSPDTKNTLPSPAVPHAASQPRPDHSDDRILPHVTRTQAALPMLVSPSPPETKNTLPLPSPSVPATPSPDDENMASGSGSDSESEDSTLFSSFFGYLSSAYDTSRESYDHLLTLYHAPYRWSHTLAPVLNDLSSLMALTIHQRHIDVERKSPYFNPVSLIDLALAESFTQMLHSALNGLSRMEELPPRSMNRWMNDALDGENMTENDEKMLIELSSATDALKKFLDGTSRPDGPSPTKRSRTTRAEQ